MMNRWNCQDQHITGNVRFANVGIEDEWMWLEGRWKTSATGNQTIWQNDAQSSSVTSWTANNIAYMEVGVPNASTGAGVGWDFFVYVDNLMTSTTRIRPSVMVELCNSATYAGATCVFQPPTTISDTSVSFRFKKGALSAGAGWIHVRSNAQVQATPIAVTIP